MPKTLFIICFFQLGLAFSQIEDSLLSIVKNVEITSLNTEASKAQFLENIFDIDQGIRASLSDVELQHGRESSEFHSISTKWAEIDNFLFKKTVTFLEHYSYPTKEMGWKACYTPQLILHHVAGKPEEIDLKKKFIPVFYEAYKDEVISASSIWMYLYRLYKQINNKDYENYNLGEEDQIEEMITKLELLKE